MLGNCLERCLYQACHLFVSPFNFSLPRACATTPSITPRALYHPTSVRVHPGGVSWQQWFGERAISPPGHAAKDDRSHAQ